MMVRILALMVMGTLAALAQQSQVPGQKAPPLFKGDKKDKDKDETTRSVSGTVRGQNEEAVDGAVVQLKDTRTLRVRSYITKANGNYFFHGLSKNSDYELKAEHSGASSEKKTLSVYDSRENPVINLQLEEAKKN
ncbi:MAG: carboxypeptidase-like regulatory domain-containing protein [Acidobacteriota bacterium]